LKSFFCTIIAIQFVLCAFAQNDSLPGKKIFVQQDIKDWMVQKNWVKKKKEKNNFLLFIPVIASNPSAGFIFGTGLSYAFKAHPSNERFSAVSANATYSTKKQVNVNVKSNVFAMKEKLLLNGDWRYMVFTESTYGLGTNTKGDSTGYNFDINGINTNEEAFSQTLRYNQYRIHETGSWLLFPNFFAGIGLHFDRHDNIVDQKVEEGHPDSSYHYRYNVKHGFNPEGYNTMGASLNFLYDSRDNQVYAYKGYFANINFRMNTTAFGSAQNSTVLLAEYRSFHSLDRGKNRHQLALWFFTNIVTSGNVPYLDLPAIGYDQRQKSGRGYSFGRFRGEGIIYQETEYRFPISRYSGILGGVLFLNVTSTSDEDNNTKLMQYFRAGYGGGLRIMLDKKSKTRLQIDAGIANRKFGFYFGAQETF